ncbi:MAG: 3-keto-disaccharide hydrolase [Planctomycetota bacterium]|jgi:hypothetical protein
MKMTRPFEYAAVLILVSAFSLLSSEGKAAVKPANVFATVAEARKAGPDFDIQGEYLGTIGGDARRKIGVQVIALGNGAFQAVFLPGGLPGKGADVKKKVICQGKRDGGKVIFGPATGDRKYLAGNPEQFSATKEFPPKSQVDYDAIIGQGKLVAKTDKGEIIKAKKVYRKSPTLGAKAPAGAVVLLPYKPEELPMDVEHMLDAMTNEKWKADPNGYMQVVPRTGSNATRERFKGPWKLHIEFRSPFQPTARGQGRGNSGVFPPGGKEIQVLDSFGLDGLPNECGGIYKTHAPAVNMCLPPLSWQTYDITYNPGDGKKEQAWYKVVHNGVVIHEKHLLGKPQARQLNLQDHKNPVAYRNIWIVLGKN